MARINFELPNDINKAIEDYQDAILKRKNERVSKDKVLILMAHNGIKSMIDRTRQLILEYKAYQK